MSNSYITNLYLKPTPNTTDQRLTVDSTAGGVQLSNSWSDRTRAIILDVQDADCFVTFDGSAPTTSNGHKLYSGEKLNWSTELATAAKFIAATGTNAIIHASEATH